MSSIYSFDIINGINPETEVPNSKTVLWISASAAETDAVNLNGIIPLFVMEVGIFFINAKRTFIIGLSFSQ